MRILFTGGSDGWEVFLHAREMIAAGNPVVELKQAFQVYKQRKSFSKKVLLNLNSKSYQLNKPQLFKNPQIQVGKNTIQHVPRNWLQIKSMDIEPNIYKSIVKKNNLELQMHRSPA